MDSDTPSDAARDDTDADDAAFLPPNIAAALAALDAAADVLAGVDLLTLDGPQAAVIARRTAAATSRITASSARMLPVVEADGLWALDGARSFGNWVAHRHHLSLHAARSQVRLGRALRDHLPLTAAAAAAGDIPSSTPTSWRISDRPRSSGARCSPTRSRR